MGNKYIIHSTNISKILLATNCIVAILYYSWWFNFGIVANPWIYGLLFLGETYHVLMAFFFWFTIWPKKKVIADIPENPNYSPSTDIFITVANEPLEIIRETAIAAINQTYKNKKIYLLNDGFVANRKDWRTVELLAQELGIYCITRKIGGGAKAGNINNALKQTAGEIIVIFDADMVPLPYFLKKMIPYFIDKKIAFVQSPQYYKNYEKNDIARAAWEQQELFYGPIMEGKDRHTSAFICGTNVAIRRYALDCVGGMEEKSITEDFLTSMKIHQKGFSSVYTSEVLATGLAPEDLLSYYKQQHRWARGSLEVLFGQNPLFKSGLTFGQKLQYLASALYYVNGLIILIDMSMPLLYLFFGLKPVTSSTINFAFYFVPFIYLNLLSLYLVSNKNITFRVFAISHSSFMLQITALASALFRQKNAFSITSKKALKGNFIYLALPHLFYIFLVSCGVGVAIHREGVNPSIVTNISWAFLNIYMFLSFIKIALTPQNKNEISDDKSALMHPFPSLSNI